MVAKKDARIAELEAEVARLKRLLESEKARAETLKNSAVRVSLSRFALQFLENRVVWPCFFHLLLDRMTRFDLVDRHLQSLAELEESKAQVEAKQAEVSRWTKLYEGEKAKVAELKQVCLILCYSL